MSEGFLNPPVLYILGTMLFSYKLLSIGDYNVVIDWTSGKKNCCCCSVAKSCLTLFDPMGCSIPGFSVLHYLPEFAQTHVHWVGDAIQPSHPLLTPSSPALNLSQHQGFFPVSWLFASGGQRTGASASASVLSMNIQGWFLWQWTYMISLQSKGLSRVFSNTTVQKHQFFGAGSSLWPNSHIHAKHKCPTQ